jgi:hypothetical protein
MLLEKKRKEKKRSSKRKNETHDDFKEKGVKIR